MTKKEKSTIKVKTKVAVVVLGQYLEPGKIYELPTEIYDMIDDVIKYAAFEVVSENEVGN